MTNTLNFARRALRGGTALQALALLGAGVGAAAIATPATAQDYTQVNATGRVQGTNGEAIAGATVTVTSNDQGFTRTVTTGGDGTFRVAALPTGSYTFTVEASGFDSFTDNAVTLNQGASSNQFTLAPTGSAASGDIIVTAGRVQVVDFDRNTTGAVINVGELATRVPVARDLTAVVLLSPGTTQGDTAFGTFSTGFLPSINGASVSENVYYINGLNITQFRNGLGSVEVPFEFYQTVEIKNGGLAAEFGRTTGGFVNTVTKSGSNEFHGGITFNWEPDDLRSDSPNTYNSDNDAYRRERKEFIAQLSGPIIKDHLFFYGIYNARDVRSDTAATAITTSTTTFQDTYRNFNILGTNYVRNKNTSPFYGGKIDAVIVDGQRLEATYFKTTGVTTQNIFGTARFGINGRYNPAINRPGSYDSTSLLRAGGENYVFRYTGTFTNWLTLSGAYGVNKNRETTETSNPTFPSIVDNRGGSAVSIGNPLANNTTNFDKRTFYRADADINFNLFGSHHIRGGYDREELDLSTEIIANGTDGSGQLNYYTAANSRNGVDATTGLPAGTQYFTARTFISGGEFKTKNEAFYIQDSWQLFSNRLSLNLGVRNDRFVSRNADGVAFYKSGDLWSPRLGASLDVLGDGSTRLYGSFSRYYLPIAVNTNVRLAGSELDFDNYYRLLGVNADNTPIQGSAVLIPGADRCPNTGTLSCVVRNDGTVPGTATTVAANLDAQSTDEIIVGAERRLGRRIKVGAFFTYTKLNDSLEDVALDQAIVPLCVAAGNTAAACRGIYNGVHQYALVNPGRDVVITLSDPFPNQMTTQQVTLSAASLGYPQAERKYKAMTFTFDREFDGKWSLSANYTYSKLVGNIEGGIRSDNGQTDSGLTTAFDVPALVNGSYGYLPNDRRHNFKIYGSYQAFEFLNVGVNAQISSPRRFGCLGRVPANVDNNIAGRFYQGGGFYCVTDGSGNVVTTGTSTVDSAGTTTGRLTPRGRSFKSDWLYNVNLDLALRIPTDAFDGTFRVSVFNVFNIKQELDFQENGTLGNGAPNISYSLPQTYQAPRSVRLQFGVNF